MAVDLTTRIGSLTLKNPVLTASGTFGYGEEFSDFIDLDRLGGFIIKGTTLHAREGNPYPRMAETPSGMLNAVGLQNKGIDYMIEHIYPRIKSTGSEIIVNVSGASPEDYAEVCRRIAERTDIKAVEINISCPNVKQGGMAFGTTTSGAAAVTRAVRASFPGVVRAEGTDAVSLINTLMGMAVDVERQRPCLSTVTGGLSGPAVRPVAVRMVWQTAKAVKIPVIGLGGIMDGRDALEFILAGASAVEIGTANFIDPQTTVKVIDYIHDYCQRHGVDNVSDLVGMI